MIDYAYIKTAIGNYAFAYTFRVDHEVRAKITQFPVHKGKPITDHMYIEPARITVEIGATDVMQGDGAGRNAFEELKAIQAEGKPLELTTRLGNYPNMLIESIVAPDDSATQFGLKATITFLEIVIADASLVSVSGGATPKKSKPKKIAKKKETKKPAKKKGEKQPKKTKPVAAVALQPSALFDLTGGRGIKTKKQY